jgi:hypothetical protein
VILSVLIRILVSMAAERMDMKTERMVIQFLELIVPAQVLFVVLQTVSRVFCSLCPGEYSTQALEFCRCSSIAKYRGGDLHFFSGHSISNHTIVDAAALCKTKVYTLPTFSWLRTVQFFSA